MADQMYIEVLFSDAGLWGSTDPDAEGYDAQASADQFAEMLTMELESEYPTSDVMVKHGINDRHMVDGFENTDEAVWVGEVVNRVWVAPFSSMAASWMVEA